MRLVKHQLKQSLANIESAREFIDSKRLNDGDNEYLENYHYEMLDIELRLKDMLNHIHKI